MRKKALLLVLLGVLLYTRLTGLNWGLPYPLHPDERNMAVAIQDLSCENISQPASCFNPHFFAYGQLPLYLSYGGIMLYHAVAGLSQPVSFTEATLALRLISVVASLLTGYMVYKLGKLFIEDLLGKKSGTRLHEYGPYIGVTAFILSPYGVQFSHFGTTESLLMLLYSAILYYSLLLARHPGKKRLSYVLALLLGLGIGVKVSSLLFMAVPAGVLLFSFLEHRTRRPEIINASITVLFLAAICAVMLSPHTVISWGEFMGSFSYESAVATGTYPAFYTRQFVGSVPVMFQFTKIFPFALGLVSFIFSLLGFVLLPWKNKSLNYMRFGLLVFFVPTAFLYAKWTRFMAPIFPLLTVFGSLFLIWVIRKTKNRVVLAGIAILFLFSLLPGLAYVSVYAHPDVRFQTSRWIYDNIPTQSKILSETANVIDIPIPPPDYRKTPPNYQYVSFDFYHLDEDPALQTQLAHLQKTADYIFIPSRRIFMNHPASSYPQLRQYYEALFSGKLGYNKIREFSSYPAVSLFGKTLFTFPDEGAEETWTVFDHPVVRIYGKPQTAPDFSAYDHAVAEVRGTTYRLLLADTPQKWEQGLMYVRSKKDVGEGYVGMMFMFPDRQFRTFWNKNTLVNLDLYWIDGKKVVGTSFLPSIQDSKQIVTVTSPKEADKVIELIR